MSIRTKTASSSSSSSLLAFAAALGVAALVDISVLAQTPLARAAAAAEAPTPAKPESPAGLSILSNRPDAPAADDSPDVTGDLLGPVYENRGAGIQLRPPAGSKVIRKQGGDEVVDRELVGLALHEPEGGHAVPCGVRPDRTLEPRGSRRSLTMRRRYVRRGTRTIAHIGRASMVYPLSVQRM